MDNSSRRVHKCQNKRLYVLQLIHANPFIQQPLNNCLDAYFLDYFVYQVENALSFLKLPSWRHDPLTAFCGVGEQCNKRHDVINVTVSKHTFHK